MSACIFEVKAGSSVMIQGECHTWEYLVLRSDLLRPGPLELVNSHAVPRVTASVIYGDTQPKVQEVESTALPAAVTTPTQSTPRGHRHAKTKSVETIDTLSGGNNAWLPDQSNGKAIGSFQPTGYIQSRATNSQPILPDHVLKKVRVSGARRGMARASDRTCRTVAREGARNRRSDENPRDHSRRSASLCRLGRHEGC